jgi:basic membrane protein A
LCINGIYSFALRKNTNIHTVYAANYITRGHYLMKLRLISFITAMLLVFCFALSGCGKNQTATEGTKVGMSTDSGTIDDKSFNQSTWEGIKRYESENGTIQSKYLQPSGEQETDYITAINDLIDSGYNLIVTPGYKFETAVNKVAEQHPDISIIILDGQPSNGTEAVKHDNVVSILFADQEAGFLAGIAAALSSNSGKLGFVGGSQIAPVERFGVGYKAGVKYANAAYNTNAEVVDFIYQGTFNDAAAGQTLAAGMYDKGIDIIFHAAGGTGVGVFNEAKERAEKGEKVYVVGVGQDQYDTGKISTGQSVTLTSAVKRMDNAVYKYIDAKVNNTFQGGETITLTVADEGVGIPDTNPNLSEDTINKINESKQSIIDGHLIVPSTEGDLANFLK